MAVIIFKRIIRIIMITDYYVIKNFIL